MTDIATIPNNEFVIAMEYSRIIEPAPTFELPNQFLVWVSQKVLAQSDLNLLLTENYNERLEYQLKNRETQMNKITQLNLLYCRYQPTCLYLSTGFPL